MKELAGVMTALITPFRNNKLDLVSFEALVKFQKENGVHGLVVNGTTGESPTLEESEVAELMSCAREVVGRNFPLVLGAGSNCTRKTVKLTEAAGKLGADAVLVVTPYYNKPPQRGLVEHFQVVAEESPCPVILYNVPGRTIVSLSLETTLILSRHKNIVGVKDATGDIGFGEATIRSCEKSFFVTSGDDATFLDLTLKGGKGVISVISNILPRQTVDFFNRAHGGDQTALKDYHRFTDLLKQLYCESNPIPVKMAAHLMGIIESPELRLPLVELSTENKMSLQRCLKNLELVS